VLDYRHWRVQDQLVRLMRDDPRVPSDLLQLREILEVEIAGLAAGHASEEQVAAMGATIDKMRAAGGQVEACVEQDVAFHQLLAAATGNVLLPLVLEPVAQLLVASRLATIHNPGAVDRSVAAHELILGRVVAGDVEGAQEAMRAHLTQVAGEIRQIKGTGA
jgi:GntR family transcriptional repressor for pyruvate dehydrogenase complex